MEIKYHKAGDYLLPNLKLNVEEEKHYGKWGQLRREFLQKYREADYNLLKMQGELIEHLGEIDKQAKEMHERIITDLEKKFPPPPQGTMEWVQWQNSLRFIADEQVFADLIYN